MKTEGPVVEGLSAHVTLIQVRECHGTESAGTDRRNPKTKSSGNEGFR